MATTKKLDESNFSKLVKDLNAAGELIRTHQDEKQAVLDDFDQEKDRYKDGKISKKTLMSSSIKANKELIRLDKGIRGAMKRVESLSANLRTRAAHQAPKPFRTSVSGIKILGAHKKKAAHKKKPAKKK